MRWNRTSPCEYDGKSIETEKTKWSEFPNGGKAIVEQILASEERNKSKRAGLWEATVWISYLISLVCFPDEFFPSVIATKLKFI